MAGEESAVEGEEEEGEIGPREEEDMASGRVQGDEIDRVLRGGEREGAKKLTTTHIVDQAAAPRGGNTDPELCTDGKSVNRRVVAIQGEPGTDRVREERPQVGPYAVRRLFGLSRSQGQTQRTSPASSHPFGPSSGEAIDEDSGVSGGRDEGAGILSQGKTSDPRLVSHEGLNGGLCIVEGGGSDRVVPVSRRVENASIRGEGKGRD